MGGFNLNPMDTNKIFNEDCITTMNRMTKNTIDAVITSPPYNTSRKGSSIDNAQANIRYDHFDDCREDREYIEWTVEIFNSYDKILKENGVVLYNLSYSSENTHLIWLTIAAIIENTSFVVADTLVWKKKTASPNSSSPNKMTRICEFIFVFCRKDQISTFQCNKEISSTRPSGQTMYKNVSNFISAPNNDESHPTHKATYSTELVRKLITMYVSAGQTVYDSFMGTGTTAVACVIENIKFVGSELSNEYVTYSNKRIEPYLSQTNIFDQGA